MLNERGRSEVVPDILAPNLTVVFCGINPGLTSAKTQHHFARPGNKFWKALYYSGFTPTLLAPHDQLKLLEYKLGITNVVARPSRTAADLAKNELLSGTKILFKKIKRYSPVWLAVLGIETYRIGFQSKHATIGKQEPMIGNTKVWLLPNPSGLNAHYSLEECISLFAELRKTASASAATTTSATAAAAT